MPTTFSITSKTPRPHLPRNIRPYSESGIQAHFPSIVSFPILSMCYTSKTKILILSSVQIQVRHKISIVEETVLLWLLRRCCCCWFCLCLLSSNNNLKHAIPSHISQQKWTKLCTKCNIRNSVDFAAAA